MVKSSSPLPGAGVGGHGALDWVRAISPRRVGILALTLAFLFTIASYVLQETLNYPAILLDRPALAQALVAHGGLAALLGFFGLLLCGLLLIAIALGLGPSLETATRGRVTLAGVASGACWAVGSLLGLALVPLWAGANTRVAPVLAAIVLALAEIAAPLLLTCWTLALARQLQAHRALGWVGAIGLLLVVGRSLLGGLNALLPIASGFYGTAEILSVLAVVGVSFWLLWLLRLGFRMMACDAAGETPAPPAAAAAESAASTSTSTSTDGTGTDGTGTMHRLRVLRGALGLGVGLADAAFVGGRTGFTIAASPELEGDDIPAEPSLIAAGYYLLALILFKIIHPVNTVAALASQVPSTDITPPPPNRALAQIGALIEPVDANGVPAERISAPGVSSSRWLLYIHGGGWAVPWTNDNRAFVGRLCKGANATALYPNYRLIPEHPFPAALHDCVATYRWLRQQGIPASHIVIAGESAGANLTLATALALKASGDKLPAALVAISPPTDMAMTGESFRTKALVDASPGGSLALDAFALYTNHGATSPRNPLVSQLYGDVHGFPPTLIQAGTQEVFLSDATRMAEKLKAARVTVKLEVWPGMFHAFAGGPPAIPEVRLATQHVTKFMRQYLRA